MARRSRRQHRREEVSSLCETCGNDLPDGSRRCIYCGSVTASQAPQRARSSHAVANVNIKAGLPTGDEAIARLDSGLAMARASGARVARIVHGYGSSGTGGVIRERVRQQLASLRARGTVRDFVAGEEFAADAHPSPC